MPDRPNTIADEHYPVVCSACSQVTAYPTAVTTLDETHIRIDIKCSACGRMWQALRRTAPIKWPKTPNA